MNTLKTIWNILRSWFDPSYYHDVYGEPLNEWQYPIVPQGMKTKEVTFKSFRNK